MLNQIQKQWNVLIGDTFAGEDVPILVELGLKLIIAHHAAALAV